MHITRTIWSGRHRKIARICALFKVYTEERAWKALEDRLQGYYLSRDDHDSKVRARKQRTVIGKYEGRTESHEQQFFVK